MATYLARSNVCKQVPGVPFLAGQKRFTEPSEGVAITEITPIDKQCSDNRMSTLRERNPCLLFSVITLQFAYKNR